MSLGSRLSSLAYRTIFRARARRRPPVARPIRLGSGSRVLLFTCAGIGDTLTDSVVAKALTETYPGIAIGAVVHRRRRLLVEHHPAIDRVFLFHKGPFAFHRLAAELRSAGLWDAILQLRGNDPEPRCLSFLLDPDVTVSTPNMTHLSELCGHQVVQPDWDATHGVEQTLRLARHVGADTSEPTLVYAVTESERRALEVKLRTWNVGARPRLVLQLGGGRRASWRDWPVTRYAELIRRATKLDAEIFVLGGADQHERRRLLETLFAGARRPYHDAIGRFTLAESAALLASARALVSTDTGIMHLGFAVGTRVVALIHCNNPDTRVGPYGYGARHRVVQLPRPAAYRSPADADMRDIGAADGFRQAHGNLDAVNFPGLDLFWSGAHHTARALGLIQPWTLEEACAGIAGGEKVLVVASTALGDSLLTTPLLETLSHYLGPERVSLLVREPFADLYREDPRFSLVLAVRGKYRWDGLAAKLRSDPHRIALLANVTEPDLVPCLWHGGVRAFLRHRGRTIRFARWMANADMLRRPGEPGYGSGHAIENNLAMAGALGLAASTHRLALPQFRSEAGREKVVVIHPGASRENKCWPVEKWAQLADVLVSEFRVRIVFTGTRDEAVLGDAIAARMSSQTRNDAGRLTLPELACAQARVAAFLSGDTGPYHLAIAVGCPTVTLFAPTDRGSSVEACGPHQADPVFHRAIETASYGDAITTLPFERVLAESRDVVKRSLAREGL